MRKIIFLASSMLVSSLTIAAEGVKYTCSIKGAEDRIIEVVYQNADATLPCDVAYTKNGETKNLWHYDNTEGACDARAAEFAEKQRGWGMTCTSNKETSATEAAPMATDEPEVSPAAE